MSFAKCRTSCLSLNMLMTYIIDDELTEVSKWKYINVLRQSCVDCTDDNSIIANSQHLCQILTLSTSDCNFDRFTCRRRYVTLISTFLYIHTPWHVLRYLECKQKLSFCVYAIKHQRVELAYILENSRNYFFTETPRRPFLPRLKFQM